MSAVQKSGSAFERRLGRLLIVVTYLAVGLLATGVVLLLVAGVSPLAGGPPLDAAEFLPDLLALEPAGFLWLGIIVVIATPLSRVVGAAVGFIGRGERLMATVSLAILGVIAISIAIALATG
jgi:uncharacterized membrane protein